MTTKHDVNRWGADLDAQYRLAIALDDERDRRHLALEQERSRGSVLQDGDDPTGAEDIAA